MSKIAIDLPVNLEELVQFSFNFNNLIKTINFFHQNNLSFQDNLKDIEKSLSSMESLKNDIDELKIKTSKIERTNENLNRSFSNLQEKLLKFDQNLSQMHLKTKDIESQVKKFEVVQIDHEQNLNHLNKVVEDNVKSCNKLYDMVNLNSKDITKIYEKFEEIEKKIQEEQENVNKNIKEINYNNELDHKEIENINNNMGEMNETIKNLMNNFEKKNNDMNNRILNIVNDVADINDTILNIDTNVGKPSNNKLTKEMNFNINKDINASNLFKISMDQIEEINNKFIKLKEDYELNKENQIKENTNFNKNIKLIIKNYDDLKITVDENVENIQNIENNLNECINLQKEEKEKREEKEKQQKEIDIELINIENLNKHYVNINTFKKLSDNVRILTSTINSKTGREEIETQLKKINQRLEDLEMITQGQTHGPRTRINLGLVNLPFGKIENSNYSNSSEEIVGELSEFDYLVKQIEKKISHNIINILNKEMKNIDFSLNPKINELIINYHKNCEDIDKNNKTIIDIRNILVTNPTKNDFLKLKNEVEKLEEYIKENKVKIIDLTKNIEGTENEEEGEDTLNSLPGTIRDKINFLNKTCQTLSTKLISLENKNKSITKEVKDDIKQNLKNETAKIMQQFKVRLESFTTKFEHELKNKIDQIGLSDFETKINNKFHIDLKEKLDKNELKKNNNIIRRKIDNLENKISKTLVDTIIDLQMDDQPLIIKKNVNGVDVCASCNQPFSRNNNNFPGEYLSGNISTMNFSKKNLMNNNINKSLVTFTQPNNIKSNTNLNLNSDRSLHNLNRGNSKLPDIVPSIHPK